MLIGDFVLKRLLSLGILTLSISAALASNDIAIVDAGSSGSRFYLYEYQAGTSMPSLKLVYSKKINPGISSLSTDPKAINQYLSGLIPYEKLSHQAQYADFYLYATAGMRLVSAEKSQHIYAAINNYLKKNTHFQVRSIKTITGECEGVYDWIAANYSAKGIASGTTYGVLDMGGASTQIAYEDSTNPEAMTIRLGDKSFKIVSKSYLGLGGDQARNQYLNDAHCFPVGYPLPNGKEGAGEAALCAADTNALINSVHHADQENKSVPEKMHFIAISGYYYTSRALGIRNVFTVDELSNNAKHFCQTGWKDLVKQRSADPYLYGYCFNANYMSVLLTNGFNLSRSASYKIENNIDWTLGAAVYAILSKSTAS